MRTVVPPWLHRAVHFGFCQYLMDLGSLCCNGLSLSPPQPALPSLLTSYQLTSWLEPTPALSTLPAPLPDSPPCSLAQRRQLRSRFAPALPSTPVSTTVFSPSPLPFDTAAVIARALVNACAFSSAPVAECPHDCHASPSSPVPPVLSSPLHRCSSALPVSSCAGSELSPLPVLSPPPSPESC